MSTLDKSDAIMQQLYDAEYSLGKESRQVKAISYACKNMEGKHAEAIASLSAVQGQRATPSLPFLRAPPPPRRLPLLSRRAWLSHSAAE